MFFIGRQAQVNHQSVATKKLAVVNLTNNLTFFCMKQPFAGNDQ